MIDDQTKEIAENFFKTASENLFLDGEVLNTFFIQEDTGKLNIIGAPWRTEEQKLQLASMASLFAKDVNAPWIMFVGEMWIAEVDKDAIDLANLPRASTHPNKQEILMMMIVEPDGKCYSLSAKIKRATTGDPYVEDKEWNLGDDGSKIEMYLIPPWK